MPMQEFGTDPHLEGLPSRNDAASPYGIAGGGSIQPMTGVVAPLPPLPDARVYLDPDDPFDRALIPIVEVSHRKRADYATDAAGPFDNFRITAEWAGFESGWVSALMNVQQKMARIQALRANGRADNPQNESIEDSILDSACYSIIALAIWLEEKAAASG